VETLGLTGFEEYTLGGLDQLSPGQTVQVTAYFEGKVLTFQSTAMIQSEYELECLRKGGIFQQFDYGLKK
jgi:aconitase A